MNQLNHRQNKNRSRKR